MINHSSEFNNNSKENNNEDFTIDGLTKEYSAILKRGDTLTQRKTTWPFDIYQATKLYPVDYEFYEREVETSVGKSKCVAMHAVAYTENEEQFPADQIFHRETLSRAHLRAMKKFYKTQSQKKTSEIMEKPTWFTQIINKFTAN